MILKNSKIKGYIIACLLVLYALITLLYPYIIREKISTVLLYAISAVILFYLAHRRVIKYSENFTKSLKNQKLKNKSKN